MKAGKVIGVVCGCVAGFAGFQIAPSGALAQSKPAIRIVSPTSNSTVRGSSVTVHVSVSGFKLVAPVYINPPLLRGDQGHIHYVLDSLTNFVATRDASINLAHSWSNVSAGRHTIFVYLATSQHARFPGAQESRISITVAPAKVATSHSTSVAVRSAPRTGGGDPAPQRAPGIPAVLIGIFAVVLGIATRLRSTHLQG